MDFEQRLRKAIDRGDRRNESREQANRDAQASVEELKSLHMQIRLSLSEHIESCVEKVASHFPGFKYETIIGDKGWGAACWRDDVNLNSGSRRNEYSRLELAIRPFAEYHVVDLASKATIGNKELFKRNYFEKIQEADETTFKELIDVWVLEYAEQFAARRK